MFDDDDIQIIHAEKCTHEYSRAFMHIHQWHIKDFKKVGPNFRWPLVFHTKGGQTMFSYFFI